ncbi:hypothetical protein BX659_1793 [Orenia metallireducens]|jgi:hypothetical protein|uniref:hypothetical protein n=1 Tax=Orenia metallireducens TaxID=1413210 RepID=UPI000D060333|nr:hypothetical protein [Orenia metallireducens]PRX15949.1 hypothetical protein BX659_1793 [Orenia metallireducens]
MSEEVIKPVYSIDKVRLKTRLAKDVVQFKMRKYESDPRVEYWEGYKITEYRHNWRFKLGVDETVYIGCQHNSEPPVELRTGFVIEYNPNKVEKDNCVLDELLMLFTKTEPIVQKLDVAVDFYKVNINWVTLFKGSKRKITTLDYGSDDKTYYIGEVGQEGRVKVYNKAKERSKKSYPVPFSDWTRYEITLKPDVITSNIQDYKIDIEIPNITYIQPHKIKDLNSTDRILLKAIKAGLAELAELPRRKKEKLKPFIQEECELFIKKCLLQETVVDFITEISDKYFFLDGKQYESAHYSKRYYNIKT